MVATIHFICLMSYRQYRGNEGQMRELQDQLEAEQYFSVSLTLNLSQSVFSFSFLFGERSLA